MPLFKEKLSPHVCCTHQSLHVTEHDQCSAFKQLPHFTAAIQQLQD